MFGQNNQQPQDDAQVSDQPIPDLQIQEALTDDTPQVIAAADPAPSVSMPWQHPGMPLGTPAAKDTAEPIPAESLHFETPAGVEPDHVATPVSDELLEIKQQALAELSPLVDHLEQTPEEKFRTTMMMIQATDNQSLVHVAYEAALAIEDEKVKAQALLDVINEINYFTHPAAPQPSE